MNPLSRFPSFSRGLIACFVTILAMTSCNEKPEHEVEGSSQKEKPEIALVMKSLANEFFKTMADGAEDFEKENSDRFSLIINGIQNETDLSQQVALVEQMVARGVDAIVIAPADSKALVPALKKAQTAGIIVINIDNKLDKDVLEKSEIQIPFVGPDNREGAGKVGDALAKSLSPGAKVAILEGVPTAFNAQQRRTGFEDAMKTAQAEIVSVQSASWEMAKANSVSSSILTEHPELSAILASNDSMALGAVAAVKAAGKEGEVLVVGFDNISAVQAMIKEGRIFATADQHGDQLAVFGIEAALSSLNGNTEVEDKRTPVDLITSETLK